MKSRVCPVILTFLIPAAANACGGGGPDHVGIAILIALLIAMAAAFLLPLAGMLALEPKKPLVIVRIFLLYGAVTVAAVMSAVLMQPSDTVTITLILLCAVLLVTPSMHYFLHVLRATRANAPGNPFE